MNNINDATPIPLEQVQLDPDVTTASAIAASAAYADQRRESFDSPVGYEFVDRFTAWTQFGVITGEEERFGLVFRDHEDSSNYLIAFRGTTTLLDAYNDLWINPEQFDPYDAGGNLPEKVEVASGFQQIYIRKGPNMAASMQTQLFTQLQNLQPTPARILVTGHSLGGALASLFTLDVAVSRPDISVVSTTFASPRVGLQTWRTTYESTLDLKRVTYRLVNYWDIVPSLPPKALRYEHIGQQFLISTYVRGALFPHYVPRHSLANYDTILCHAVRAKPQVWVGEFPDATTPDWMMISTAPPSATVPEWSGIMRDAEHEAVLTSRR